MQVFQLTSTLLQGSYRSARKIEANIAMQSISIDGRYAVHGTDHLQIFIYAA